MLGVDAAGDVADRIKDRLSPELQTPEHVRDRRGSVRLPRREGKPDDERHQLALHPVVQVPLQPSPLIHIDERRSCSGRA